jgi:hypothetical protein
LSFDSTVRTRETGFAYNECIVMFQTFLMGNYKPTHFLINTHNDGSRKVIGKYVMKS